MKNLAGFVLMLLLSLQFPFGFSQTWQKLDSLRLHYQQKPDFDSAFFYAEKALLTVKEEFGERDTLYADMLRGLLAVYTYSGNFSKALEIANQEIELRKELQGEGHVNYGGSCIWLGYLNIYTGNFSEAYRLLRKAISIFEKELGKHHHLYVTSTTNLAGLYMQTGRYADAIPILLEGKRIRAELFGEESYEYAQVCGILAECYRMAGKYVQAEPMYLKSVEITEKVFGRDHPNYGLRINNLALFYSNSGNFVAAEPYIIESKNIYAKTVGKSHNDYAASCNNLADLYYEMGNLEAAEPLYLESRNIWENLLGKEHPTYATITNNLASLYQKMGRNTEAEPLIIEAKGIRERTLGYEHPDYAVSLINLATLYRDMKRFDEAEKLLLEAKGIYEKLSNDTHPVSAKIFQNLGTLYSTMSDFSKAESQFLQAKKIREELFGNDHHEYAETCHSLGSLYFIMGDLEKAKPFIIESISTLNRTIFHNFSFLTEREKELYYQDQSSRFDDFYAFAFEYYNQNPAISEMVYNNILKNKGLLLKSSTAMRNAIHTSADTSIISLYDSWVKLRKEIANTYSQEISKRSIRPEELEKQANNIEKELVRKTQIFNDFDAIKGADWLNVKKSLKPKEAAIEFIHFQKEGRKDSILYAALVVTSKSNLPHFVGLFYEKELQEILGKISDNNLRFVNSVYGTNLEANNRLYNTIWKPLEKYLKGINTIYLSPSGLLHKISFPAIASDRNILLCDAYNIHHQTSTAAIAYPNQLSFDEITSAALFGGIDYNTDYTEDEIWGYLEGTRLETERIMGILEGEKVDIELFTKDKSTEEKLKMVATKSNILHIATHGFFYPNPSVSEPLIAEHIEEGEVFFRGGRGTRGFGLWSFVRNPNPLMRAGLTFAGANRVWLEQYVKSESDGVLTADEVVNIDMRNTQLVVLSACETGLGDIRGSEGVYGLQRAFKMAGAKYIIMSLWQVPDKETVEFMEAFYTKLLKSKDIRNSFTETQREMRKKYDPYYWAAFVLVE